MVDAGRGIQAWPAGRPVGDLLDAVLDAERALGAGHLEAPPAAQAEGRVAALAEQVADAAVGEAHVNAGDGEHHVAGASAVAGAVDESLDVGDVAAEVAHHGEGMRQERLEVGVGQALHARGGRGL